MYYLGNDVVDSIELKCFVVSRGVKVDKQVYQKYGKNTRLNPNPLMCNCMILSDGTIVQLTDMSFHLKQLGSMLSWNNIKLMKYASQLGTPFTISLKDERAALMYNGEFVDFISFAPPTDFYKKKTSSGMPYIGNAVLQGLDWVAFQCLWPCEFGAAGKPCEFCFSGAEFETLAAKKKPLPKAVLPTDVAEIVKYAFDHVGCNSIQITGGSTFCGKTEATHIKAYLSAICEHVGLERVTGDLLLYITPPEHNELIDEYFSMGATRIACSIEVWDEMRAEVITPGKMQFTTRRRHLDALNYISEKYGPGKAFSNFIIGIEPFESLKEGAVYLAERGIIPTASIWMPMGRPVMGTMQAPNLDFYRRVKDLFAELYQKYHLEPAGCRGLNVCMERDIWKYSQYKIGVGGASTISVEKFKDK